MEEDGASGEPEDEAEGEEGGQPVDEEREAASFDEFDPENVYLIASAIDPIYMVEVADGSTEDLAKVQLYEQSAEDSQRWRFEESKDGRFAIVNVNSGMALTRMEPDGGTCDVLQRPYDGNDDQLWNMVFNDDSTYSFEDADGNTMSVPSTTLANTNKVWVKKPDDTARKDFYLKVAPNEKARGHWTYAEVALNEIEVEDTFAADGGDAISAACMALAGFASMDNKAPSAKSVYNRPPNVGYGGDWTVYNQVTSVIPVKYHASCDDGVSLAVRYSGVDDSFPKFGPGREYEYMSRSTKWSRVGGKGSYWHRTTGADGGWGDPGVDLQPGDVLIRKSVETQHNYYWAHVCIYVGTEKANMKYPGSDLTYFEESFERKRWAYVNRYDKVRNGEYCVFRRNDNALDVAGSVWAGVCPEAKLSYSSKISSTRTVKQSFHKVKEDYVYDDYQIKVEGLPEGCEYQGLTSFAYDTPTFKLENPLMSEDYLFEGWYTAKEGGEPIRQVEKGTMDDIVIYAHTRFLPTYTVRFDDVPDDLPAVQPIEFKETAESFELPNPEAPEGYNLVFEGWYDDSGAEVTQIAQGTTQDVSLHARWMPNFLAMPYILVPIGVLLILAVAVIARNRKQRD